MNALTTIRHIMQRYIGKQPRQVERLRYAEQIRRTMLANQHRAAASSPSSTASYGNATSNSQADYGSTNILERIAAARGNTGSRSAHDKWWLKP